MEVVLAYLEAELKSSETELENLRRQDEGVHARISKLEAITAGLRHLIAKESPTRPRIAAVDEWTIIPRTEAVQRVLQAAETPLSPRLISKQLITRGRVDDTPNAVSGALSRLKISGRAQPYGSGLWIAAKTEAGNGLGTNGQVEAPELLDA
jgi:hypothetical protein